MSNKSGYKQQQDLSIAQLLAELPSFVAVLVDKFVSGKKITLDRK